jgi:hypothetical protein
MPPEGNWELGERSGFLHCASHDKTVRGFGRNDGFLITAAWGRGGSKELRGSAGIFFFVGFGDGYV